MTAARNGRVLEPELLASAPPAAVAENLRDLVRLNRWFGPRRLLTGILDKVTRRDEAFTFLDVGAASGDMGAAVQTRFPRAMPVSLDSRIAHLGDGGARRVAADAFRLPFREGAVDYVFCSLLLHEYSNPQIETLLERFYRTCRRALIILDLYRHPLPYHFLPATQHVFGWSEVTVHDGPVSVAAGFRCSELAALARSAGLKNARVQRHLPWFRLSLVALHPS